MDYGHDQGYLQYHGPVSSVHAEAAHLRAMCADLNKSAAATYVIETDGCSQMAWIEKF